MGITEAQNMEATLARVGEQLEEVLGGCRRRWDRTGETHTRRRLAPPLPCMHTEEGERMQQQEVRITSRVPTTCTPVNGCGQDDRTQVCVTHRSLKTTGASQEKWRVTLDPQRASRYSLCEPESTRPAAGPAAVFRPTVPDTIQASRRGSHMATERSRAIHPKRMPSVWPSL